MLEQWMQDPKIMADALGVNEADLQKLTPEELIDFSPKLSSIRFGSTPPPGTIGITPVPSA